ncbi:MAG: phage major capsid protein [Ruminococcus sp.]
MYKDLKLEKGMYHITGKSFTEVLESMDPSGQYAETPLAGLDAYERQLKRFDIRVSGPHCDRVEKFFSTTESAVLFPEFIRRTIRSGLDQSVLSDIVAVQTSSESGEYQAAIFNDTVAYSTKTTQGNALPTATYLESTSTTRLEKFGRAIQASYEAIRRQRLDSFATALRAVGVRLANGILVQAVQKLEANAGSLVGVQTTGTLTYADLTKLYGAFQEFNMNTVLAAPAVAAKVMALEQMTEMASTQPNMIMLPFGAQLRKCAGMSEGYMIGLDDKFGLEMITSGDLLLETDKIIDSQLDVITVSLRVAFRVIMADAVHVLSL